MSNPPDSHEGRTCRVCGEWKPREQLIKSKQGKWGVDRLCLICHRAYHTDFYRKWRADNREKSNLYSHEWKKRNPDHRRDYVARKRAENLALFRAKLRAWGKAAYPRRREKILDQSRKYYQRNRVKRLATSKIWAINNPAKVAIYQARRRAHKLALPNTFTEQDWKRALEYFGGRCAVCGRPGKDPLGTYTIAQDHWIALSKGGPTTPDNIVPLCHGLGGCNDSKHNRPADKWLIQKFGHQKATEILQRVNAYFDWIRTQGNI